MNCTETRQHLHLRADLAEAERAAFDAHIAACAACRRALLETERLEDLWLSWEVPAGSSGSSGSPASAGPARAAAVLATLRGEGPQVTCEQLEERLHELVAGDIEPWQVQRHEDHVAHCLACRDHREEARHVRRLWLGWQAPAPAGMADRVIAALREPVPAPAALPPLARYRPLLRSRLVAALLLVAVTLAVANLLQREGPAGPAAPVAPVAPAGVAARTGAEGLPLALTVSAGSFDASDVFSSRYRRPLRGSLLQDVRRW